MSSNPYAAYRTVEATTADPVTLTTMLYDGAVKALKKARLHHENETRGDSTRDQPGVSDHR